MDGLFLNRIGRLLRQQLQSTNPRFPRLAQFGGLALQCLHLLRRGTHVHARALQAALQRGQRLDLLADCIAALGAGCRHALEATSSGSRRRIDALARRLQLGNITTQGLVDAAIHLRLAAQILQRRDLLLNRAFGCLAAGAQLQHLAAKPGDLRFRRLDRLLQTANVVRRLRRRPTQPIEHPARLAAQTLQHTTQPTGFGTHPPHLGGTRAGLRLQILQRRRLNLDRTRGPRGFLADALRFVRGLLQTAICIF